MRSEAPSLMPIFRSRHQAELLTWLLLHPRDEFTMTDLARRLEVPLTTLHREVDRLVSAGLITSRTVGRARLLSANGANPASGPLTQLVELTFGPKTVVEEEFTSLLEAGRIIIFGSWAERYYGYAGAPPNDIDVMVIGTVTRAAAYEAAARAEARLGVRVNPVRRSVEQWDSGEDPLVAQVQASPYVQVFPPHVRDST